METKDAPLLTIDPYCGSLTHVPEREPGRIPQSCTGNPQTLDREARKSPNPDLHRTITYTPLRTRIKIVLLGFICTRM